MKTSFKYKGENNYKGWMSLFIPKGSTIESHVYELFGTKITVTKKITK